MGNYCALYLLSGSEDLRDLILEIVRVSIVDSRSDDTFAINPFDSVFHISVLIPKVHKEEDFREDRLRHRFLIRSTDLLRNRIIH